MGNELEVKQKTDRSISILNPQDLLSQAIKQNVGIEVLEKLLDMRDRIQAEEAKRAYMSAMSAFQAECPIIKKSKSVKEKAEKGGKERYKYATIDCIVKAVQPLLKKHELSYNIKTLMEENAVTTIVTACHVLGHREETSFSAPIDKTAYMSEPQKWASAATFTKRNAFCNAFGILTGDDDNDGDTGDAEKNKAKPEKLTGKEIDELYKKLSNLIETSQTVKHIVGRANEIRNSAKPLSDDMRKKLWADYKRRQTELVEKESKSGK